MKLSEITKPVIQRQLNAMSKQEEPPYRTMKGIRDTLKQIFNEAVQDELLRGNPAINVVLPKPPKKSQAETFKAFSPEMRRALLQAADQDTIMAPILHFLFWNGSRIGEALALNWGISTSRNARCAQNRPSSGYMTKICTMRGWSAAVRPPRPFGPTICRRS